MVYYVNQSTSVTGSGLVPVSVQTGAPGELRSVDLFGEKFDRLDSGEFIVKGLRGL